MKLKITSKLALLLAIVMGVSVNIYGQKSSTEVIEMLKAGNERYVSGNLKHPNLGSERIATTSEKGQFPYVTIISCSDSRVPVEYVFDAGIGDIFVIRVAGNVVNTDEAGSIEYGVEHLHTPLLVVLGHTQCGAVTAVCKGADVHGNIPKLVENIVPAVEKAKKEHNHSDCDDKIVEASIYNNVWQSIEDLYAASETTKELVESGKLMVVGAMYHLDSGKVEWLGQHPEEEQLLR